MPRTFNMGFSRRVWEKVGGFREMFSEDIDMSTRIRQAGFAISLIREAYVYHKRRVNMRLFCRQVYVFGMSRITLYLLYPDSLKLVHWLPAVFVTGVAAMAVLAAVVSWMWLLPLVVFSLTGCGLKGPLYFPPADKTAPPPTKSVQPQSQSTTPEKNDRGISDGPSQVNY